MSLRGRGAPVRVTAVMTHPIQYISPWFRWITARVPEIELTVLYAAVPTAQQQGEAFGQAFEWDSRPLEGYRYEVCAEPAGMTFTYDRFWGVDARNVGDRIAGTRPDVVLIAGWHSAFQVRALIACRRRGIPTIYRGDSNLSNAPEGLSRRIWERRTWFLLRLFRGWLSVGTRATEYLRHFSLPAARIESSPHCVDHEWFAARAAAARLAGRREALRAECGVGRDDLAVLFVGRLVPIKRPLDLVRSIARLGRAAVLIVAGDGPLLEELRTEAAHLGVRIVTAGFRNQGAIVDLYVAADVLLLPSISETWGLVVNEALAAGLPCVVSSGVAAGIDLIRDGQNGHVVPVGDVSAIASALADVGRGLSEGRYGPEACQNAVSGAGYREAAAGLLALSRRLMEGASGGAESLYRH